VNDPGEGSERRSTLDATRELDDDPKMTRSGACVARLCLVVGLLLACDDEDNREGVGNHCLRDDDCPTKLCYLGPGGGYCTSPCEVEGDTAACPQDTICKPIQGGARRCLLICGSDSTCSKDGCPTDFCPAGSACTSVSNANAKACEPSPGS
jgi:hypothetical protein